MITNPVQPSRHYPAAALAGLIAVGAGLVAGILSDVSIYPDQETLANLFSTTPYDAKAQRVLTRVWTSVKTGM